MEKPSEHKGPVEFSLEIAIERLEGLLADEYGMSRRAVGLLLLQEDGEIRDLVAQKQPDAAERVEAVIAEAKARYARPVEYEIALRRREEVERIIKKVVVSKEEKAGFGEKLSRLMMNPWTGFPILFAVLYLGLYKFVGTFGAGTVVNFIESVIFEQHINPFVTDIVAGIIPWKAVQELFVGEYGVITLGVRYALALVLPIVTFFFIIFSVIEDSGYLPRLAMLIDRTFKRIGLSGRAVIPMVLGFGCDTMATMVTRTLPTSRERIISTMLLALAVPCSAQLGVILALLSGRPVVLAAWAGIMTLVFLLVGYLTAKILPGEKPSFYMEVPPLRLPLLFNVFTKTYVRVKWYLKEIIPLFLLASVLIWFGQLTGVFDLLIRALHKPVRLIGLPDDTASIFLFGFFRRDYGAAGLYDLDKTGVLSNNQILVACVALTLFLPCIAQFLINLRERGWKMGVGISVFVLFFSFAVALALNSILNAFGVTL